MHSTQQPHSTEIPAIAARESLSQRIAAFQNLHPAHSGRALQCQQRAIPSVKLEDSIPVITADQLTSAVVDYSICTHGGLIVRKLLSAGMVGELRSLTDRVIDSCTAALSSAPGAVQRSRYYDPPDILGRVMPSRELANSRSFHNQSGSAMCVESPHVAEKLLQLYSDLGLYDLMRDYLGEKPCLSVKKWVLRRSRLPISPAGWHQDGAFMGTDISSLNMWLPLTRCGGQTGAPGLDVLPARLHGLVDAKDACFEWSVSPDRVDQQFTGNPPVAPVFEAGDAFFFDHFYLHRTQFGAHFTDSRYAIETWFFGANSFPKNQLPLAW